MNNTLTPTGNDLPVSNFSDIQELHDRLFDLIEESKRAQKDIDQLTSQGFIGRFVSNITGETSQAFARAGNIQAQLQEAQVALAFFNLQLVGLLKAQQDRIDEQQRELAEANKRLEAQQSEIQETTANVEKQQKTILNLLELSQEQEERIRKIVQTADYVRKLEETFSQRLDALASDIKETPSRVEVGEWVQRRLEEETEKLSQAINTATSSEAEARSEAEQRLEALIEAETATRKKAIQKTRRYIDTTVSSTKSILLKADSDLQRELQFLKEKHNATSEIVRRLGVAVTLAFLVAAVALIFPFL